MGYEGFILDVEWPKASGISFKLDSITMVVQVNGKLRSKINIPHNADTATIETTAKQDEKVQQAIQGAAIKKIITVPGKLVNIVTGA